MASLSCTFPLTSVTTRRQSRNEANAVQCHGTLLAKFLDHSSIACAKHFPLHRGSKEQPLKTSVVSFCNALIRNRAFELFLEPNFPCFTSSSSHQSPFFQIIPPLQDSFWALLWQLDHILLTKHNLPRTMAELKLRTTSEDVEMQSIPSQGEAQIKDGVAKRIWAKMSQTQSEEPDVRHGQYTYLRRITDVQYSSVQ